MPRLVLAVFASLFLVVVGIAYGDAGGLGDNEAPGIDDVPLPSGWTQRFVGADGGSGGTNYTLYATSPIRDVSPSVDLESTYRDFLATEGWVERDATRGGYGSPWSYQSEVGLLRATVELRVDRDREFERCCYYGRVGVDELVVIATYPDWGESLQFRRQMVVLAVAAGTLLLVLSFAAIFASLLKRRRSPMSSSASRSF